MRYVFLLLSAVFSCALVAQNDRSLSPYFSINVDSGQTIPDFPLQLTSAEVEIAGIIADVTVTQVYTNHSQRPIEAVYVFPGSTNAAVYAMEMQIGRRTITAEIREKSVARQEYTQAKQDGKTASLLEQQRPNVFTMNVANIMPGDSIVVRMSYTERLVPTDGVYEFVYPTVVAPRYTGVGAVDYNANLKNDIGQPAEGIPYAKKGVAPTYAFNMNVKINSSIPFEFVQSPTHKVLLSFEGKNEATVLLDKSESDGGNRDFVLSYRFAGGKIETGLMLYEGKEENFFMLMLQPPKRVPIDSIPPREYIFVMDVSGSMNGYPLETSKKLLKNLVSGLRPTDKFNIVQFAGGAALFAVNSVDATQKNIDSALVFLSKPQGSGGTELNSAMRTAMNIPKQAGYSRSIVIATDGLISAEAQVYQSMRDNLDEANVFAFGIGSSCNRYIIEGMAFCGSGEPFVVMNANTADSAAERFRHYISSPVMTDISVQYTGFDVYDVEPVAVPDLFAERPLVITGKYRGKPSGKITVDGMTGAGAYHKELRADSVRPKKQNKAIRLLWARDRVKYLSYLDQPGGYNAAGADSAVGDQILAIGLKYGLLTNYTSFIAIDRRERNKEGVEDSTIQQELPMPQNMENSSIGMYGFISSVQAVPGVTSVADASYCIIQTIAPCIILPSRPVFPHHSLVAQDPGCVNDLNWTPNGNYIRPVFTATRHPLFTPGASARIAGRIPGDMVSYYTQGPTFRGDDIVPPLHAASVGLNSWVPESGQVTLMSTQKGNQSLYFSYDYRHRSASKWHHIFEVGEQWNPVAVDFDEDGRLDFETGFGATLHERTMYNGEYGRTLQAVFNDVLVHWSSFSGGQPSIGYNTYDRNIGIYTAPEVYLKLKERMTLKAGANFGYASLYNEWGVDRFHLNTITTGVHTDFELSVASSLWTFGGRFNVMSGDERWNTIVLDQTYNSGALFAHYCWNGNNVRFNVDLRGEYDDINQGVIIPGAQFIWQPQKWTVILEATRYRSAPFTIGQLTPLFYSSRNLRFTNPGADQGWYGNLTVARSVHNKHHFKVGYSAVLPEYSVIVNTDADENLIDVYSLAGGAMQHRGFAAMTLQLSNRFTVEATYRATYVPFNYGERFLQQPLLPRHRGLLSAKWTSSDYRWIVTAEGCYTGKQRLPLHGWSKDYVTANLLLKFKLSDRFVFMLNGFNLFNYRQPNAMLYSGTPGQFDGWMQWAPLTGTSIQAGVKWKFR